MKKHKGFTLIELLIVIVILGILAAYAVPKYMNLDREARAAVTKGLKGSIHAAADMVHGRAVMQNNAGAVIMSGYVVLIVNQYPSATMTGIATALADISGFTIDTSTANTISFSPIGAATPASCRVTYVNATGVGIAPVITLTVTDCS